MISSPAIRVFEMAYKDDYEAGGIARRRSRYSSPGYTCDTPPRGSAPGHRAIPIPPVIIKRWIRVQTLNRSVHAELIR